ncbi:SpdD protein [Streptomyces sp. FT1]|uniref:SpdD protein n=1 Tax=Streptomyces sp. FT1 TaxID=2871486 RepID=UPI00225B0AEE|nr:SpdD protein [Streptomyces sp. FT1]MCX5457089.1 SpdD protein [Streptomyces sp. FT1]
MFTPKYPPTATPPTTAPVPAQPSATVPPIPATPTSLTPTPPARPAVQLTPGALVALAAGGTATVLVVGTVLVSMLLAVAITAASVAVCAVVVRSLINQQHKGR